jgi:hypothetical protein
MKYIKSFLIGIFCFVAGFLFYFIIQKQYNIQSIYNHQYDIESFETDTSPTLDPSASLIACSLIDETQIIQNVNNFLPFIDVINNGSNKKNNPKNSANNKSVANKESIESENNEELKVNLNKLIEESRSINGIHDIYGEVYSQIGFDHILKSPSKNKMVKDLVMARIANPSSKRKSVLNLEEEFGINLNLDSVYKVMDDIDETIISKIQQAAYNTTKSLLGGKVDVLFYDCTTLYFESFSEDDFKCNGYSKDLKFNQPQLVLAMFVTKEGLPVGYEIFPGNCYEGHTLLPILAKLKTNYDLDRVIFVADSGMLNSNNLGFLEENNFE